VSANEEKFLAGLRTDAPLCATNSVGFVILRGIWRANMTQTLRILSSRMLSLPILAFAALALIVIPLFPTASSAAPRQIACEDSQDCPSSMRCQVRRVHGKWVGHCVGLSTPRRASLICENSLDCPIGDFCNVRPGRKTGQCVDSSARATVHLCQDSSDCASFQFCRIPSNRKTGQCVTH
jgi:hypothetical protein